MEREVKQLSLAVGDNDSENDRKKTPEACINLMRFCAFAGG